MRRELFGSFGLSSDGIAAFFSSIGGMAQMPKGTSSKAGVHRNLEFTDGQWVPSPAWSAGYMFIYIYTYIIHHLL